MRLRSVWHPVRRALGPALRRAGHGFAARAVVAAALVALTLVAPGLGAQQPGRTGVDPVVAAVSKAPSRATLQTALAAAERRGDRNAAATIRRRLTEGDVGPGDRLAVTLTLDSVNTYEFVVRDSQRVDVLPLGTFSLRGVLRSELPEAFRAFYARYYKNPDVRVQSLIRFGFLGAVGKPGYFNVPPDVPVTEAFTQVAGGPGGNSDPRRITIYRGSQRLYDQKGYARAARDGLTFDEAGLRSGDELRVPERRQRNITQLLQVATIALSAFVSLVFLIRSANNN